MPEQLEHVVDAEVAGDLPRNVSVHSKSGSPRTLHLNKQCGRLSNATQVQTRDAGAEDDDRPVCEWCRGGNPHGVVEDALSTRDKLLKMSADEIATDGGVVDAE